MDFPHVIEEVEPVPGGRGGSTWGLKSPGIPWPRPLSRHYPERRITVDRGPTLSSDPTVPVRDGSKLSQTTSHRRAESSAGTVKVNGSHHELTSMRKSSSVSGVPAAPTSGSVEPSMNNAILRAMGSDQLSAAISVPAGVNQRRSAANLPVE